MGEVYRARFEREAQTVGAPRPQGTISSAAQ